MNSRKFYAVPEDDGSSEQKKHAKKLIDLTESASCICDKVLTELKLELEEVNGKIKQIFTLTKDSPVPIAYKKLLKDAFKCKIYHVGPLAPPVIVTKCYKTLIGCQECVNTWYATNSPLQVMSSLQCIAGIYRDTETPCSLACRL